MLLALTLLAPTHATMWLPPAGRGYGECRTDTGHGDYHEHWHDPAGQALNEVSCRQMCEADAACLAYEFSVIRPSKMDYTRCELHFATVTHSVPGLNFAVCFVKSGAVAPRPSGWQGGAAPPTSGQRPTSSNQSHKPSGRPRPWYYQRDLPPPTPPPSPPPPPVHPCAAMAAPGTQLTGAAAPECADMTGIDLRGRDLSNIHFGQCDLTAARFDGAILNGAAFDEVVSLVAANFTGASLVGARFHLGSARGADFTRVDAAGAEFDGILMGESPTTPTLKTTFAAADLSGVRFTHLFDAKHVVFDDANLASATISSCILSSGSFERVNLAGASLEMVDFDSSKFSAAAPHSFQNFATAREVSFDHCNFGGTEQGGGIVFDGVQFEYASFSSADISGSSFRGCQLVPEADFSYTIAKGTVFDEATLQRGDFLATILEGASFHASDLTEASFIDSNIARADFTAAIGLQTVDLINVLNRDTSIGLPPVTPI